MNQCGQSIPHETMGANTASIERTDKCNSFNEHLTDVLSCGITLLTRFPSDKRSFSMETTKEALFYRMKGVEYTLKVITVSIGMNLPMPLKTTSGLMFWT